MGNLQYIRSEILKDMPSKAQWNTVSDRWDPAVMGKWNVRCRTIAIIQLLGFYHSTPLYKTFMAVRRSATNSSPAPWCVAGPDLANHIASQWVKRHPELCAEPAN